LEQAVLLVQIREEPLVMLDLQQVVLVVALVVQEVVIQFFLRLHQQVVVQALLIEIQTFKLNNREELEDQVVVAAQAKEMYLELVVALVILHPLVLLKEILEEEVEALVILPQVVAVVEQLLRAQIILVLLVDQVDQVEQEHLIQSLDQM
tara:strand:- start:400 stop:849 length:450 start_codon:yes stop_codon:yes gene_type:complete